MNRGALKGYRMVAVPHNLVKNGSLRFVMIGDVATVSRRMDAEAASKRIDDWIRTNGTPVDHA